MEPGDFFDLALEHAIKTIIRRANDSPHTTQWIEIVKERRIKNSSEGGDEEFVFGSRGRMVIGP